MVRQNPAQTDASHPNPHLFLPNAVCVIVPFMVGLLRHECHYDSSVTEITVFYLDDHLTIPRPTPCLPPPSGPLCLFQMPHMRMEEQQMGARRYQDVERGGSVQGGGNAAAQVHVGTHTPAPTLDFA